MILLEPITMDPQLLKESMQIACQVQGGKSLVRNYNKDSENESHKPEDEQK